VLGVLAGYFRGIVDTIISRMMDAVFAFPSIFFGLVLAVTLGPGLTSVFIAISIVLWARFAKIIRDEVVTLRERDFIARARVSGCSGFRILTVHILPNILSVAMVVLTINFGYVILLEASLSYLGAGIPPPTPSWGSMIAEGQNYIGSAWWISIPPGVAIALTVLGLSLLGDWLRERLDPQMRDL
jgi:peptide/nickel transport system permease protein